MAKNPPLKNEPISGAPQALTQSAPPATDAKMPEANPPEAVVEAAVPPTVPPTQDTTVRFSQPTPAAATQVVPGEQPFRADGCDLGEGHRCIAHKVDKLGESGTFMSCGRQGCPNYLKIFQVG